MAKGQPLRYNVVMDTLVRVWLGEQGHTEGTEVGPEEEVERMEGVCASAGMLDVVLSAKLSLR